MEENIAREDNSAYIQEMRERTTEIGWKYATFVAVIIVMQTAYQSWVLEKFANEPWANWAGVIVPIYLIGFPILYLLIRKMPGHAITKKKMSLGNFMTCIMIGAAICCIGAVVGLIFNLVLILPFSLNLADVGETTVINSDSGWRVFAVCICAPIFEELIFRKLLIERVLKYGEFLAIMLSGIMFGLFHGNFQQLFFATGLGMLWAFIYVRTGRIWYTIVMHMIVNISSSVITTFLAQSYLEKLSGDSGIVSMLTSLFLYLGWLGIIGICVLLGIIFFFVNLKKFRLRSGLAEIKYSQVIRKGMLNWGMILFGLTCLCMFIQFYLSLIRAL